MRKFNVVVLGAGGVGKSALTVRYIRDVFIDYYDPTIEESYRRDVHLDGQLSTLEILDTAGAEQFTSLNEVYIQAGLGFVLVFSLTQEASLKEVDHLRQQIYGIKGGDTDIPIVVVGTKLDLVNEREVQKGYIQDLANRWEHPFYETSAKRNWHVSDVFEDLLRQMRKKYPHATPKKRPKRGKDSCIVM
ncbi:P-loop containing nucleoside triphosphate hydrolase protein [Armillaria luteobubalina]|uniref:P-loop containing nucleoside triphosphate hydrolase protein n=1 Tax=Armillaria luteobubalina TaxID=153913 RepID=A0AA39UME0_9AGAR|nr:P-loop containing nucleoside triphosphate hydrolase protein [Armillaria luteobubalina]